MPIITISRQTIVNCLISAEDRSKADDFPEKLSKVLLDGWYADMKSENTKFIVFKDKVLKYEIGNAVEKKAVLAECRARGIPDEQLDWSE